MTENPFESPVMQNDEEHRGNPLKIPAICLGILSTALLFVLLLNLPQTIKSMISIDITTPEGQGELFGILCVPVIYFAIAIEVIRGSVGMLKFNRYDKARAAAIVAMIPVCSPFIVLGIPFGIWAFVLLRKPEIKARFQDTTHRTAGVS